MFQKDTSKVRNVSSDLRLAKQFLFPVLFSTSVPVVLISKSNIQLKKQCKHPPSFFFNLLRFRNCSHEPKVRRGYSSVWKSCDRSSRGLDMPSFLVLHEQYNYYTAVIYQRLWWKANIIVDQHQTHTILEFHANTTSCQIQIQGEVNFDFFSSEDPKTHSPAQLSPSLFFTQNPINFTFFSFPSPIERTPSPPPPPPPNTKQNKMANPSSHFTLSWPFIAQIIMENIQLINMIKWLYNITWI